MIDPNSGIATQLLGMGLPGIIIMSLGYAVVKLFNLLQANNEARITEAKACVEALSANATALDEISKLVEKGKGT